MMEGPAFLTMWIGFLLLMIACTAAFFLWAVRTGQFSGQDRARYLPLDSCPLSSDEPAHDGGQQHEGRRP